MKEKEQKEIDKKKVEQDKTRRYLIFNIGAIVIIALVMAALIIPSLEEANQRFTLGFIAVLALGIIYRVTAKYMKPVVENKEEDSVEQENPYHGFFFRGTVVLTMILILMGIFGGFFVYVEHNNLFQAIGLMTALIWIGAFLMYFMWSVYHYNINYGITDKDWNKIFEAEKRHQQGFPVNPSELEAPKYNPYRSQTFGLPPGTVRGMIAFTLLIGGMSLLVVSFGTEYTGAELALVRQQFEFFETAFLMMIAFYFGDKSLKYLQKRWSDPNKRGKDGSSLSSSLKKGEDPSAGKGASSPPESTDPKDQVHYEDQEHLEEDTEFAQKNDISPPSSTQKEPTSISLMEELQLGKGVEYVQILDNLHHKVLSDEDIKMALEKLKSEDKIELSLPVVQAIIAVESSGRGHLQDGKAKILFEGHKFWYWLEKFGKNPEELQKGNDNIVYKKWTRKHYLIGSKEYKRLDAAKKIDEKAAIYSASWGLFQILGENLEHHIKGRDYLDVHEFEEKQHETENYHFLDFLAFIKTKILRGKALIHYISEETNGNYDWESFAYGYNGSGYKVNQYDQKLKAAYNKFKTKVDQSSTGLIPIIDTGHGGMVEGQYVTTGRQYRFSDDTVIYEGVINRLIGKLLAKKLEKAGIPFFHITLETEADIDLMERVQQANTIYQVNPSSYLLSIHSNATSDNTKGKGNTAKGFEVYTSVGQTKSDELATIASKWYKKLFPEFVFRENKTDAGEFENKEAAYTVLTKTKCPAFLVRNLFYDNKKEAEFLLSEEGQKKIAECLFQIVKEIHQKVKV
ncbi:MAG: N-acetylmuramidase domain-containing protein [Anditalea sp.]